MYVTKSYSVNIENRGIAETLRLCTENETFKVYKKIRLSSSNWNKSGSPEHMLAGDKLAEVIEGVVYEGRSASGRIPNEFNIISLSYEIVEKNSNQVMVYYKEYRYHDGWLNRYFGWQPYGKGKSRCVSVYSIWSTIWRDKFYKRRCS